MLASVRGRIVVATLILASMVAWGLKELRGRGLDPFSLVDEVIFLWFMVGFCGLAAIALATARWWGRLLPLAIASLGLLLVLGSVPRVPTGIELLVLLLIGVLFLCVSGRAMFERFEARAPLPMNWTAPGMNVVRWALIARAAGLIYTVTVVIYLAASVKGSPLRVARPYVSCWEPRQFTELGDFLVPAGIAVVLMGGLVLLARQRTLGLFVTAVATLAETVILMRNRDHLVVFAPGLILTWAALIVWSRPVLRFLRAG